MHISDVHDYSDTEHEPAKQFLSQNRKKAITSEISEIVSDEFDRLEEYANEHISQLAASRAERFLERVLEGDEDAAMALIGDRSGGSRFKRTGMDAGKPWASIIHGTLFETNGITLRRQIAEAHAGLIRNERIADLESIIEGLRAQIAELEQCKQRMSDRYY